MSKYCNCFVFTKNDTIIDTCKTEKLINIYDSIHKSKSNEVKSDFTQLEYNKTLSEVNKIKQKLFGNISKKL
jgi:hypothetical protein